MPTCCLPSARRPIRRFRPITLSLCLAPGLLGVAAVYFGQAWFAASVKKTTALMSPMVEITKPVQPETAQERLKHDLDRAQTALATSRLDAEKGRKHVDEEGKLWAAAVVLEGQNLARKFKIEHTPVNEVPADGVLHPAPDELNRRARARQSGSFVAKRENVAQFQSRQLYGALELNADQWRQVDRTLGAYYQEGYARRLNREARPSTGADGWRQQRADLSRHAFSAVDGRLTPDQSARFHRIYQAEDWLWSLDSGV